MLYNTCNYTPPRQVCQASEQKNSRKNIREFSRAAARQGSYDIKTEPNVSRFAFEVAYRLVDRFHKGEGIGVLFEDVLEVDDLMLADHAQQHFFFGVAVRARACKARSRAMQFSNYLALYVLRVQRDDHEFVRRLGTLEHKVADERSGKAIQHAQHHGTIVVDCLAVYVLRIDEKRRRRDSRIDSERDPKEIELRFFVTDELRHDVRAAAARIYAETHAVKYAVDKPGYKTGKNRVHAACVVLKPLEIRLL